MQKNKIISSLAYKFTEKILVKGLGLVIGIILARLLAPEIFGQLAILMVFINLSQTIIDGGLNTALVQKKDVTEVDYSVVYYLSTGVAVLIITGLFFLSPTIASFYDSPDLIWPLRAYSFVLIFGAFNSVQVARLQKQMRFRSMMWANLIATIIAGTLGIVCAYMNFGLWALVIYNFSQIVFVSITMMFIVRWFPKLHFSGKRAKVLFGFGWKMLVSSMLCSLYNDIRSLVIGKKYSTEDLGYYNKGQQFPDVISHSLDQSIQSVMFPAMASEQDRLDRIKNMFNRSLSIGAFVIMPIMAGFALVAEPFVRLVLTEKWLPCVFFLQMCCIAYMATPLVSTNLILIKSLGKGNTYMILELIRRLMMLIILVCSIIFFDSVKAIAVGFVISTWLDVFFVAVPTKKLIGVGVWGQFKQLWKTLLAVALMSVATWAVSLIPLGATWIMLIQIVVGVLSYVGFSALLKVESFFYIWKMIKKLFTKKSNKDKQNPPNDKIPGGGVLTNRFTLSHCDLAKVLMMLTVIIYHCICLWSKGGWFTEPAQTSSVLAFICSLLNNVHIYVFAFVSGFLFYFLRHEKNKYRTPLKDFKGRANRLLKPFAIVSLVWVIPFSLLLIGSSFSDIINNFVLAKMPEQLWFLVMLFVVFSIFYLMSDIFNKTNFFGGALISIAFYGVGFVGGLFLPNYFQILTALRYVPFYWLGFYFRKNQNNFLYKIPFLVYLIAFIGVFSANYFVLSESSSMMFKLLSMMASPISCVLGTLTVVVGLSKINPEKICKTKVFKFLNKHNFNMYLFHQQLIYITITLLNGVVGIPVIILANLAISIGGSIVISLIINAFKKRFGYK